jgi:glutamyl-tRNA synthetase
MNAEYIRALAADELSARMLPFFVDAGLDPSPEKLRAIAPLIRERIRTLREAVSAADFFFVDELPPYDPSELIPQKGDAALAGKILRQAGEVLAANSFEPDALEQALRETANALGVKTGPMFQPIRVAVCGRKYAPPLFETMAILGREVCLERMRKAEAGLQSMG